MGDNVKKSKSTLLIIGLLLIGIVSFFIYNHQQKDRFLKFEGYEISLIEEKVDKLYNKDRTDLADNLTLDGINEVEQSILDVKDKKISEKNQTIFEDVIADFGTVQLMFDLELSIDEVFEEDSEIVKIEINDENITKLEEELEGFQEMSKYYIRNTNRLVSASEQVEAINLVQERLDELFEDGELREDITDEELEEVRELINTVKNSELKDSLLARLEGVEVASAEEEELENTDNELDEQNEEIEVVRDPEPEREPEGTVERAPEPEPEPVRPSRPAAPEPEPTPEPPTDPVVVNEKEENGEIVEIPFETNKINNATLPKGQEAIVQYGKPGQEVVVYKVTTFSDGTETKTKLRTDVIRNPENRIIQVGTATTESEEDSE